MHYKDTVSLIFKTKAVCIYRWLFFRIFHSSVHTREGVLLIGGLDYSSMGGKTTEIAGGMGKFTLQEAAKWVYYNKKCYCFKIYNSHYKLTYSNYFQKTWKWHFYLYLVDISFITYFSRGACLIEDTDEHFILTGGWAGGTDGSIDHGTTHVNKYNHMVSIQDWKVSARNRGIIVGVCWKNAFSA